MSNFFSLFALICGCPPAAEIDDIPVVNCPEDFGQLQKVIFTRRKLENGNANIITIATTDPAVKATWTALKSASDNTKVQVSPFIQNPETEPGAKREFGGGNATLGGIPIVLGAEPTTFSGVIYRARQDVIKAIKAYGCENLGVYLVNENGQIAGQADDVSNATTIQPFPIDGFFVGDKKLGGFEEPDSNAVEWAWPANWSDNFYAVTPTDFKANTDI